jgi:hypothetical protein
MKNKVVFIERKKTKKKEERIQDLSSFLYDEARGFAFDVSTKLSKLKDKIREKKGALGEDIVNLGWKELPKSNKDILIKELTKAEKEIGSFRRKIQLEFKKDRQ